MDNDREYLLELQRQIKEEENKTICNDEKLRQLISEYEVVKKQVKDKQKQNIIKGFNNMEPFKDIYDIPSIPKIDEQTYKNVIVPNLIRCGAIPKTDLVVGKTYIGDCRNATEAVWNGNTFTYKRYKFGIYFDEDINHFEDDDGYDLFVPIKVKDN